MPERNNYIESTVQQVRQSSDHNASLVLIQSNLQATYKKELLDALDNNGSNSVNDGNLAYVDKGIRNRLTSSSLSSLKASLSDLKEQKRKKEDLTIQESLNLFYQSKKVLLKVIRSIELLSLEGSTNNRQLNAYIKLCQESIVSYLETTKLYLVKFLEDSSFKAILKNIGNEGTRTKALKVIIKLINTMIEEVGAVKEFSNENIRILYKYVADSLKILNRLNVNKTINTLSSKIGVSDFNNLPNEIEKNMSANDIMTLKQFDAKYNFKTGDKTLYQSIQHIIDLANSINPDISGQFPMQKVTSLIEAVLAKIINKYWSIPTFSDALKEDIKNSCTNQNTGYFSQNRYNSKLNQFQSSSFTVGEMINIFAGNDYPIFKAKLDFCGVNIPDVLTLNDANRKKDAILSRLNNYRNKGAHKKKLSISKNEFENVFKRIITGTTKNENNKGLLIKFLQEVNKL